MYPRLILSGLLFEALRVVEGLVDCKAGFTGRMQATLDDGFMSVNESQMCAAEWCIKVLVHGAFDDDGMFQQGISSRCGYTGGDRAACVEAEKTNCSKREFYDGMRGTFSFCCCREDDCNAPRDDELESIFKAHDRKNLQPRTSYSIFTLTFLLLSLFTIAQVRH